MDAVQAQGWMAALWILWALALFGGFVIGKPDAKREHRIPRPARMTASALLVMAAWVSALASGGIAFDRLTTWTALGMTFGFIGDLFMAGLLIRGDTRVMGGIGAFGIGHVLYIIGIVTFIDVAALYVVEVIAIPLVLFWIGVAVVGWYRAVWRGSDKTPLHRIALGYALLLAGTAAAASVAMTGAAFMAVVMVGAALFLISDLILASQLFKGTYFHLISDVVWFTYSPGQMLIVYGVALTWLLPLIT